MCSSSYFAWRFLVGVENVIVEVPVVVYLRRCLIKYYATLRYFNVSGLQCTECREATKAYASNASGACVI